MCYRFKRKREWAHFCPEKEACTWVWGLFFGLLCTIAVWFGNCATDLQCSPASLYFLSPTASVLFGMAASMRTCKDAAEFPSSCRQCWMSHAAVKSRQINSKHYGSSHISLALLWKHRLNWVRWGFLPCCSENKQQIKYLGTWKTCETMFSSFTEQVKYQQEQDVCCISGL